MKTQGAILSSLGEIPLRSLRLPDLSDEHAARLTSLKDLHTVRVNGSSLTDTGFAAFIGLTGLQSLDVRGATISPTGYGPLAAMTKLTSLSLSNVGDEAMALLSNHYELTRIEINSDILTDAGIHHLCDVISLQTLELTSDNITDDGLRDFWRLQRLNTLILNLPNITGEGFGPVTEAKKVNRMWLRSKSLKNDIFDHIATMPVLKYLVLGDSRMGGSPDLTDEGLLRLVDAERLTSIELQTTGTQITDDGIARLKEQKPDLRVQVR